MKIHFRILIFILLLIWNLGIFSQYFITLNKNFLLVYPFVKKSYSLVCHQQESKLIYVGTVSSEVCARCSGIYLGALTFSLFSVFVRTKKYPSNRFLFISTLPMFIDVFLYSIGIYQYSKTIAFVTGFLFGSVGFSYFYGSVNDLLCEIQLRK